MLERTPFYAEQGGQAADTGLLASSSARFAVHDTRVGPWSGAAAEFVKLGCCWRCRSCLQWETRCLPSAGVPRPVCWSRLCGVVCRDLQACFEKIRFEALLLWQAQLMPRRRSAVELAFSWDLSHGKAALLPDYTALTFRQVFVSPRPTVLTTPAAPRLTGWRVQTAAGYVLHVGSSTGSLSVGDEVTATIDDSRRARILPNHTFTHVLNLALREV